MLESAHDDGQHRSPTPLFDTGATPLTVRVHLLGGFRVIIDDRVIPETAWRLSKARKLIQVLCLAPGHSLHREQIMDLFWPDLAPKAAAGNLYQIVHAARRALMAHAPERDPRVPIIHLRQQLVALEPPGELWTDVDAFIEAAANARGSADLAACKTAIQLYTGDLLPEHPYDEWLVARRSTLRDTLVDLLFQEARLHQQLADLSAAGVALRKIIEIEPVHEQAHADLMRIYALNGEPALALEQYRRYCERLDRDLDEQPGPSITRIYEEIVASRATTSAAKPTTSTTDRASTGNLREPLTNFIGRHRELAEVLRLAQEHRLVTLTGAGGCGKSRLARAAASALSGEFPDGTWLVELAALADPNLILKTIARALGIAEQSELTLEETLIASLRQRRLLIVLDNCEHMLDACAACCTAILEACPQVHIIATSRERLRSAGEQSWRVPSLTLPDERASTPEQIMASDAVQLFIDRARLVQPGVSIDAESSRAIATICRRLEGIPLAIELAAARIGVLSFAQIADRLDDALRLLSTGDRSGSARHQTLRAALDWGYALLTEPQQRTLNRLSVFAGGWTLDASRAVLNGDEMDEDHVEELVLQLAERSLVQVEQAGDEPRYSLLEIVRQYAHERLTEQDERNTIRHQHAVYYARLADATEAVLRGPDQSTGMRRLDDEIQNVRAALNWADEVGDVSLGLQLCWGMWRYWQTRGTLIEGRRWITRFLNLPVPDAYLELRTGVLFAAARFAQLQSDDRAMELALECLASAREINHLHHASGALTMMGHIALQRGDIARARKHYEEALNIRRELGEAWSIAISLNSLGLIALEEGEIDRAQMRFSEGTGLFRVAGDVYHVAISLFHLGNTATLANDPVAARRFHEESLDYLRQLGDRPRIARGQVGLAQVLVDSGQLTEARALLADSLGIAAEVGAKETIMCCLEEFAVLAATEGQAGPALRLEAAANALRVATGEPPQRYIVDRIRAALAPARRVLTADEQAAAVASGAHLSVDEAIRLALSTEPPQHH